jgi:chromosome transmission fidelity protein 4
MFITRTIPLFYQDMIVRVVDSEEGKEVSFSGHGGPVLCVALDPAEDKQFVASTACDGTARVWNLQSEGQLCQLDIELPKTPDVSTSNTRCPVAWAPPNGRNLAVASHTKVKIFERDTWKTALEIKPLLEKEELISALTWSSDGQRLAVATTCGRLFLYRQDATALAVWKTDRGYAIVGLSWHPAQDTLALVDNRGYWKVLDSLGGKGTSVNNTSGTAEGKSASKNDDVMNEDELAAALFDDSDDENSFSIRQIKKDTGFLSDEDSNSMKEAPNKSALDAKDGEGLMPPPAAPQPSVVPQPTIVTTGPPEVEPQQPFQPSSTPSHLSSFFMVWNAVGVVKCLNDEDEPSVEVEFHDSAVHHPMHLGNAAGHTMADLSSTCLALACEAIEDELKPSRLVVHHFSVADAAREWTLEMPEGEEIMAIACSREWVAVATDRRRLRLYTASGMQRDVLSLPGPVVALAGHGDRLVIVVHSAPPSLGSQYMAYALLDVPRRMLLGQRYQPLPLTPRATLSWLGFSDEGSPCSADGAGVVRLLDLRRRVWREVCDTHVAVKSRSDNHFVLGVSEAEWNIRTILCKGSRYPLTLPRPTPGLLRMSLPLCEPATERASMEANLLTDELSGAGDEASLLMKLFALACRGEADSRALDVARLMDAATVQVAMKYAAKSRRPALASRLSELACQAQERETATADSVDIFDGASSIGGGADRRLDEVDEDEEEAAENPLLAAKAKRENAKPRPIGIAQNPSRNPFKKSSAQSR